MNFKNVPEHIWWSVNGVPYAKFTDFLKQNQSLETFDYQIICDRNVHSDSFRKECLTAAKLLPDTHLAIPVSGSDSEIIARCAKAAGKQATIYYEDYPWADPLYKEKSKQVADELGYDWVYFEATYDDCINRMKKYAVQLGHMYRGFLISLGMFDKIPDDQYIVGGIGELEKDGYIYKKTLQNCLPNGFEKDIIIPCPPSEMIWWLYGEENNKEGNFSFFASTLELIKSQAMHPLLNYGLHNKGICNTMEMKNHEWPELVFKAKTDHFHPSDEFYQEIYDIMKDHYFTVYNHNLYAWVNKGFCGFVNYSKLFNK
jgi:hypothetical protein